MITVIQKYETKNKYPKLQKYYYISRTLKVHNSRSRGTKKLIYNHIMTKTEKPLYIDGWGRQRKIRATPGYLGNYYQETH